MKSDLHNRSSLWPLLLSLALHLSLAVLLSSQSLLQKLVPPVALSWDIVPAKKAAPPPVLSPAPSPSEKLNPDLKSDSKPKNPSSAHPPTKDVFPKPVNQPRGRIGKPPPTVPPKLVQLHGIGDEAIEADLGLRVVLRLSELSQTPHRRDIVGVLGAFPDTRLLVAGTAIPTGEALAEALLASSDWLVIATTDPTGYRRSPTALVAVGRKLRPVFDQLAKRRVPDWDERDLLWDQPDLLAFWPRVPVEKDATQVGAPDAGTSAPPALSPPFAALRRSLPKNGPALSAEYFNLRGRLRLRGGVPTPRYVQCSMSKDVDPLLTARLVFETSDEAEQFRALLVRFIESLRGEWRYKLFGISTLLDKLSFEVKANELLATGAVPAPALRKVLGLAQSALLMLPSLAPEPPPDLTPSRPTDGGEKY